MAFDPKFLDLLRSRLRISEIIATKVNLKKRGRDYIGLCPFHHEKTPSFTVNDDKEFYHCFGCGAHGDAIEFLVQGQNYSFLDAVTELAARVGLEVPQQGVSQRSQIDLKIYEVLEVATKWFQEQLMLPGGSKALYYLKDRDLSAETIQTFRIGFAPSQRNALKNFLLKKGFQEQHLITAGLIISSEDGGNSYDRFRGRVVFPIKDVKGRVVAFGGRALANVEPKYLNSPETPVFIKGQLLYGYFEGCNGIQKDLPIVIAEGYMDVIALHRSNLSRALAPLGTALTEEQIKLSWRLSPEPILCFDGDNAGLRAAIRAAERVLPILKPGYSLRFAFLPNGEDPDSMVSQGRKDVLASILGSPQSLIDTIWFALTSGELLQTPEKKALLNKKIETWVSKIVDSEIKMHYRLQLKDRYFHKYVKKTNTSSHKGKKGFSKPVQRHLPNFFSIQEKVLVAIVLNHPNLLSEVSEDFASIEFKDSRLGEVRNHILTFCTNKYDDGLDSIVLKEYIKRKGMQDILGEVLSPKVYIHADFAKPSSPQPLVQSGWKEVFSQYSRESLNYEVKQAQSLLGETMEKPAWDKLRILKKVQMREE